MDTDICQHCDRPLEQRSRSEYSTLWTLNILASEISTQSKRMIPDRSVFVFEVFSHQCIRCGKGATGATPRRWCSPEESSVFSYGLRRFPPDRRCFLFSSLHQEGGLFNDIFSKVFAQPLLNTFPSKKVQNESQRKSGRRLEQFSALVVLKSFEHRNPDFD